MGKASSVLRVYLAGIPDVGDEAYRAGTFIYALPHHHCEPALSRRAAARSEELQTQLAVRNAE